MRQLLSLIAGLILMAGVAMFSLVMLPVLAALLAGVFGWFWWKTRALRKALREQQANAPQYTEARAGSVYEGEVVVVDTELTPERRLASVDLGTGPTTSAPDDNYTK